MASLAAKGKAALEEKDYKAAIDFYSRAINANETAVDYYLKRYKITCR